MAHPIHPAIVHFPIACWSLSTCFDIATIWLHQAQWLAGVLLILACVFALPAMLSGLFELTKIPKQDDTTWSTVNKHMFFVCCAFVFYTSSLFLRLEKTTLLPPGYAAILLSVLGFLCLLAAGAYGAKLVYFCGVGQSNKGKINNTELPS